jgi:hypothetical protein
MSKKKKQKVGWRKGTVKDNSKPTKARLGERRCKEGTHNKMELKTKKKKKKKSPFPLQNNFFKILNINVHTHFLKVSVIKEIFSNLFF